MLVKITGDKWTTQNQFEGPKKPFFTMLTSYINISINLIPPNIKLNKPLLMIYNTKQLVQ